MNYTGKGNHSVRQLEQICEEQQEKIYQEQLIKQELVEALEIAMYEVRDWHEYNYDQIDSFENNGTNKERDMQADVANGIYEKLQTIKAAIQKAKGGNK